MYNVGPCAQGNMLAERAGKGKKQESGLVGPGSVVGAAAFLSSTRSRTAVRAAGTCRLAAFGPQELEALLVWPDIQGYLALVLVLELVLGVGVVAGGSGDSEAAFWGNAGAVGLLMWLAWQPNA